MPAAAAPLYLENQGLTVSIGTTATDATADTYTQVRRLLTVSEFGTEADITDDPTCLEDTSKRKRKQKADAGAFEITGNYLSGDAGQLLIQAAAASTGTAPYNIKVEFPNVPTGGTHGEIIYLKVVMSKFKKDPGGVDGIVTFAAGGEVDGAINEVAAV